MIKPAILLATLLAWASSASALQVLDAAEGQTLFVKVSAKEQTRIAVVGGRIASLRVPRGALNIDPDEETGQVFFTLGQGIQKPVSGFLTTEAGQTYALVLAPSDIPTESVLLRPPQATATRPPPPAKSTTPFEQELKRLHLAVVRDEQIDGAEVREIGQVVPLWKEARFSLERQYLIGNVVVERYSLSNVSSAPMVLSEPEFYRRGVHSVHVDQHSLAAGAATRVVVTRERSAHE